MAIFNSDQEKIIFKHIHTARCIFKLYSKVVYLFQTIIEKFEKHNLKNPNENIAYREFCIFDRKIYIKYHYGKGNVTASTRTFIKPSISEMGEGMIFKPELTYGYQAEIGTKPLSNLQLFILFEEQLKEEQKVINYIRDTETQVRPLFNIFRYYFANKCS